MLSLRHRLLLSFLITPLLCAFLYWTDSDPAYPNVWDTVKEVCFVLPVLFALVFGVLWLFRKKEAEGNRE